MIAHVVRRASTARRVDAVVVATDDKRIYDAAAAAGAEAVITGECASGTDRVAEAVLGRGGWEIVVNVQGDEPLIAPENIDALVEGLRDDPGCGMATLCLPLSSDRVNDPNAVKVVRTRDRQALYFSRSVIPFPRHEEAATGLWRLHLGIYAFRRETLRRFVELTPSPLERAESLEQLRALENGIQMLVFDAPRSAIGVDTPEDLERVERMMDRENF